MNLTGYQRTTALHHFAYSNDFARVQQLLRAGAHVNKSENNAVRFYLLHKWGKRISRNMAKLLFAAGDHVGVPDCRGTRRRTHYFMQPYPNTRVPKFLRKPEEEELNLMSMCRAAVRRYMLLASNLNLFMRVPTLEIPCVLMDYLLYDMSVEKDYDLCKDNNNIGDDDDGSDTNSECSSHSDEDDSSDYGNSGHSSHDDDNDNSDNNNGSHGDAYSDDGSQEENNHSDNGSWNSCYSVDYAHYYSNHSDDDSLGPDYDPFESDDDY